MVCHMMRFRIHTCGGIFPRVLDRYARNMGLFSMEAAVHKMTGHTAEVFGLVDGGVIRVGAYADLVMFDPATVCDPATFAEPTEPAEGILKTWINGRLVYIAGKGVVAEHTGRLVTRNRPKKPVRQESWSANSCLFAVVHLNECVR
jgi:N-acyl-D-amino-acid deacylase